MLKSTDDLRPMAALPLLLVAIAATGCPDTLESSTAPTGNGGHAATSSVSTGGGQTATSSVSTGGGQTATSSVSTGGQPATSSVSTGGGGNGGQPATSSVSTGGAGGAGGVTSSVTSTSSVASTGSGGNGGSGGFCAGNPCMCVPGTKTCDDNSTFIQLCDAMGKDQPTATSCPLPPRQIAPLSTAIVTSQTPTLHWTSLPAGSDGVVVDLCSDRACSAPVSTTLGNVTSFTPAAALKVGVHFWRLTGTLGGVKGTVTSPVWQFSVGHHSAAVSTSWGTTLDINGDGFDDFMVATGATAATSSLLVYLGGPVISVVVAAAPTKVAAPGTNWFNAGDVNGDGFPDVIVTNLVGNGSPQNSIYILPGGPGGLGNPQAMIMAPPNNVATSFGYSAGAAGDVNGDGYSDIIVGSPSGQATGTAAVVYLGGPNGIVNVPTVLQGFPPHFDNGYSRGVVTAGDLNGSGFSSVLVNDPGTIYIYPSSGTVASLQANAVVVNGPANLGAGMGSAGDVNGDGYADIIGGEWQGNDFFIWQGSAGGLNLVAATHVIGPAAGNFGLDAIGVGDLNGDGFGDVLSSGNQVNGGQGSGYVYMGAPGGLGTNPLPLPDPGMNVKDLYSVIAPAGDVNGDGFDDVIGVIPFQNSAYLYMGTGNGLNVVPLVIPGGVNTVIGFLVGSVF